MTESADGKSVTSLRELPRSLEPPRDLWPQMLERLSRQPVHIPWFDWALAALVGAAVLIFPGIIPALFYHL